MQNNQLVYEFQKNSMEKIRLEFRKWKGRIFLDMRIYYNADEDAEDWRPTKKGITVRTDLIPKLKDGVDKAQEEWEKQNQ